MWVQRLGGEPDRSWEELQGEDGQGEVGGGDGQGAGALGGEEGGEQEGEGLEDENGPAEEKRAGKTEKDARADAGG